MFPKLFFLQNPKTPKPAQASATLPSLGIGLGAFAQDPTPTFDPAFYEAYNVTQVLAGF